MANEYTEMHRIMKEAVAKQDREGWASPEIEDFSRMVLKALWACANNNPPGPILVQSLARYTEDLARARERFPTI